MIRGYEVEKKRAEFDVGVGAICFPWNGRIGPHWGEYPIRYEYRKKSKYSETKYRWLESDHAPPFCDVMHL
jgi:hypothetical protein